MTKWFLNTGSKFCIIFNTVPGPPESVRVTPLNETRVELFWSPPSHINGRLLEYQARYFGYNASEVYKSRCLFVCSMEIAI